MNFNTLFKLEFLQFFFFTLLFYKLEFLISFVQTYKGGRNLIKEKCNGQFNVKGRFEKDCIYTIHLVWLTGSKMVKYISLTLPN